jgi:hypothetical protein
MDVLMRLSMSNTMSLEEHVEKINKARDKVQAGIFEMAENITEAVRQLGGKQVELAIRLGMSKGTLSKWISIGSNLIIMSMKQDAPSSFNSLYQLSSLDNQYSKYYGEEEGKEKFTNLFKNKKITNFSDRNDIARLIKSHKEIIKEDEVKEIKHLVSNNIESENKIIKSEIRLKVLVKSNLFFNTIIVIPSLDQIEMWKNCEGDEFINEDYPIGNLENSDQNIFQQCLIKIKAKDIEVGLKCLKSWGYVYSDILMPNQPKKGLVSKSLEYLVLKGERGEPNEVSSFIKSHSTSDLMAYAEKIGQKPFLLVGDVTVLKEWVYCVG